MSDPILIGALDHRDSLKKILSEDKLSAFKKVCTESFLPYTTHFLLDPEYGLDAIDVVKNANLRPKLILSREISGYRDNPSGRLTELYKEFTSAKLKEMGADLVKLLIYYNADAQNADEEKSVIEKVRAECDQLQIPLLLEIITYPVEGHPYHKGDSILRAVHELRSFADILKLEYPMEIVEDDLESAIPYLTEMSSSAEIPWVLLSRGMEFHIFKKAVKISKQEGCASFAVGRAVWQEFSDFTSFDDQINFIKTTAAERFKELCEIYKPN